MGRLLAVKRLLAIRLHALGDVLITLPYLNDVKRRHPDLEIDLLTRDAHAPIPRALGLFTRVHAVRGGRGFKELCLRTAGRFPALVRRRYDLILDLQNNEVSRTLSRALRVPVGAVFDRFAPRPAGQKVRETLECAGLGPVALDDGLRLPDGAHVAGLERHLGRDEGSRLVVLNPAGAFPSRHWPLDSYVRFAQAYRKRRGDPVRFVVLGLEALRGRAAPIREALGEALIDLVGQTTQVEAFAILQRAEVVLSEDSGLMHMAWVSGVPVLALFGSSRGDWSRPLGAHSLCLDSGDLECGFCMAATCRHGDNRCLTRHEPSVVAELALGLVRASAGRAVPA